MECRAQEEPWVRIERCEVSVPALPAATCPSPPCLPVWNQAGALGRELWLVSCIDKQPWQWMVFSLAVNSKSLRFRRRNPGPRHVSRHGILSILTFCPTAVMQCVVFSSGVEPSVIFLLPTTVLPEKKRAKFLLLSCFSRRLSAALVFVRLSPRSSETKRHNAH